MCNTVTIFLVILLLICTIMCNNGNSNVMLSNVQSCGIMILIILICTDHTPKHPDSAATASSPTLQMDQSTIVLDLGSRY